jgi:hypothetical protein
MRTITEEWEKYRDALKEDGFEGEILDLAQHAFCAGALTVFAINGDLMEEARALYAAGQVAGGEG